MRAYNVSKQCDKTLEEKIRIIKGYEASDLLYVLRQFEKHPMNFDEIIIEGVVGRLYDMGIMCM